MSFNLMIVIVTCLISYGAFQDQSFKYKFMHIPFEEHSQGEWYRMLSSGFIHRDWVHLLVNMFVLYSFGEYIELRFTAHFGPLLGKFVYLGMYLLAIVFASLPSYYRHREHRGYAALGASGAVSAVLLAYVVFAPWNLIYLYAIVPIPAIVAAVLYLAYSYYADKKGGSNIGHDAHFYGAVFGFFFTIAINPSWANGFISQLLSFNF